MRTSAGVQTVTGALIRLLIAVGLAAGMTACTETPPAPATEPVDPPATGTAPVARFVATVQSGSGTLHISYQISNDSGDELIVLNRVPVYSAAGSARHDVNAVYVIGGGDDRVQVAKRAFTMPEGIERVQYAEMLGETLGAGRTLSEDVTVPMPLHRIYPYGDDLGHGVIRLPDRLAEVIFCLGVVRRADLGSDLGSELSPRPSEDTSPPPPGERTVTLAHSPAVAAAQHLFCTDPVALRSD
jgi:hypothetical protein